ncbi:MAG: protein-L-isoaspartate(D-aspartate) O-methyltransferase [Armatimonadota bacterium]
MKRIMQAGFTATVVLCLCMLPASCERDEQPEQSSPSASTTTTADSRADERNQMVDRIIQRWDITSDTAVEAMHETRRHLFVPEKHRSDAYLDTPLPIGHGQTISAPSIVALMTDLLRPQPDDVVLEVGTGSGYQAAVLAHIVKHVYTIEIIPELAESAERTLKKLGYDNVSVRAGDGYKGWPESAPFEGIIVTCAPTDIPQPLVEQLAEGGRMVIPVGQQWQAQDLYVLTKKNGEIIKKSVLPVRFVPMTGEAAAGGPEGDQR